MRIDVHTHIYPERVAPQVVAQIEADLGLPPVLTGLVDDLVRHLEENRFDAAVTLGVAPVPRFVEGINRWLRDVAAAQPRVIPFGTLHANYPDFAAEIGRLREWGFKGVKLHPLLQHVEPDDRRLYPIYEALADFTVLFHTGWGTAAAHNRSLPQQLSQVRRDFPRLTMILAHWGGVDQQEGVWEHLIGKDVYFDTSCPPGLHQYPAEQQTRFIQAHGGDRILFGSDSPFGHSGRDAAIIETLPLPAAVKDDILGGTARRLLGVHPESAQQG